MGQIVNNMIFIILAFQLCAAFSFDSDARTEIKVNYVRNVPEKVTDETTSVSECTETEIETRTYETTRTWQADTKADEDKRCPRYREPDLKFHQLKMLDVWQTFYYQLPDDIRCFKIFIRRVTKEDKRQNLKKYGNFNGNVDWDKCNMEVKSATVIKRKHFLQGEATDGGIFDNIIIEEVDKTKSNHSNSKYVFVEESADQWLTVKNLLLMRDCDTGGIVVFARVPTQPSRSDLEEALKDFGEPEGQEGKMACEELEPSRNVEEEESTTDF